FTIEPSGKHHASQDMKALFLVHFPRQTCEVTVSATPFFMGLMVVELVVSLLKDGTPLACVSDVVTSVSAGIISRMPTGFEITTYIYMWNNFYLLELPWDSAWAWWLAFLVVDFGYYWVHRFAHGMVFYLPMALAVPPSVFAVHIQFNLVYQFWIHTEVIRDMGPLEWVLNTPSHHRGKINIALIKITGEGTFAPDGDKVVYGLVHIINTFEFKSCKYLWRRYNRYKKIFIQLGVLWKGPSWKPGKPKARGSRRGARGTATFKRKTRFILSQLTLLMMTGYILLSLTSIGFIIDQRSTASMLELLRCVLTVMLLRYGYMTAPAPLVVPIEVVD
uniref:Alkylglycerol monooxygenase C-terminal domain-containing protein n=1 Tax=Oncorhynchus tshawytscha TaxID=74940 RepID=A0A8C8FP74_ONCTS